MNESEFLDLLVEMKDKDYPICFDGIVISVVITSLFVAISHPDFPESNKNIILNNVFEVLKQDPDLKRIIEFNEDRKNWT